MNLKSRIFDKIRVKPQFEEVRPEQPRCQYPGCSQAGEFRAPMGHFREGQYFCFCLDHVREYNGTYNYFSGMSAEDFAQFQRNSVVGHRPTWRMGALRGSGSLCHAGELLRSPDSGLGFRQTAFHGASCEGSQPRWGVAALKALYQLGLDDNVDMTAIKARYKDLVKRLHPDANAGDRSNENKLQEIIRAYNYLKSIRRV
jgi:DnaJ-domain-containing protein 1